MTIAKEAVNAVPQDDTGEYRSGTKTGQAVIETRTLGQREITVSEVDGLAVFEGDIVIGPWDKVVELEGIGITGTQFRWPNAVVPFDVDSALPNAQRITDAVAHWTANTNIRFVPRTAADTDYVHFARSTATRSPVGRQGGRQDIEVADTAPTGSVIHEMGHSIGLWHEQSREDRDKFITVHFENMNAGDQHNFDQHITDGDDIGTYDFGSIMHYSATGFSTNGKATIVPKVALPAGVTMGQRNGLSAGDIQAVFTLYRSWFLIHPEVKMQRGATVTALTPRKDHIDLFSTGTDGAVWSTFWEPRTGWVNWFLIHPEVKMQPGATVTALVPRENHIDLFVTGTDGAVWSTWWEPGKPWQNWFLIHPEVKMRPGATVTALVPRKDHIDLFVTGTDGAVWSTFWEPGKPWQNWFLIHPEVKMQPGATVTALVPRENHIDLFVTGTDGAVWSTFWEPGKPWQNWFLIHPEVKMRPGATVTALVPRKDHIDLFVTGTDGAVWSTFWEPGKPWQNWFLIHPEVKMQPGATVTALVPRTNHIDLFVTGTDGAVWSTWWEPGKPWQNWFLIHPDIRMQPRAEVSALVPRTNHIDLFVTGTDGAVWSTWWEPTTGWF
ncbi:M12 family metallopeptidase [Mycobacterium sp. URHD0025]|uniref:M12 family metallopeptidase n=1 Tax=Mycobacterium sp. URHD0025 TaxID=1298864 RepID=UPI0018CA21A2|nr:M12 family metallopeptidase [Mycobacterium sp. URHD0025]